MSDITLASLAKQVGATYSGPDIPVPTFCHDSRLLQPGDFYIAIKGAKVDGHKYIEQAIAKQASGLLISEPGEYPIPTIIAEDTVATLGELAKAYRANFKIPFVAITGSMGKTTTREMLASVLKVSHQVLHPEKNLNTEVGVPITLFRLKSTHQMAVMELSATKAGDIAYLMDIIQPDVAVITNAGPCHLESMGGLDGVAKVKGEIFDKLATNKLAIVNVDDAYAPYWLSRLTTQNIITFASKNQAKIMGSDVVTTENGFQFNLQLDNQSYPIQVPILGTHNISNALAAIACAYGLNISIKDITTGLAQFKPFSRRLEILPGIKGAKVIEDSYNANPIAMRAAIGVLADHAGEKFFVMGDMLEQGDSEQDLHRLIGAYAKQVGITNFYTYGPLAKLAAETFGDSAQHFEDKQSLINILLERLNQNSVVLIKGSNSMGLNQIAKALAPTA